MRLAVPGGVVSAGGAVPGRMPRLAMAREVPVALWEPSVEAVMVDAVDASSLASPKATSGFAAWGTVGVMSPWVG